MADYVFPATLNKISFSSKKQTLTLIFHTPSASPRGGHGPLGRTWGQWRKSRRWFDYTGTNGECVCRTANLLSQGMAC